MTKPGMDAEAQRYLDFLEGNFPGWRSIELFGPPGAGKSHICSILRQDPRIRSSYFLGWDDLVPPSTVRLGIGLQWLPEHHRHTIQRTIYRTRANRLRRAPGSKVGTFLEIAYSFLEMPELATSAKRLLEKNALRSCYVSHFNSHTEYRILFDEGIVFLAAYILTFFDGSMKRNSAIELISNMLDSYPGQKNALRITSDIENCIDRQKLRNNIVADDVSAQIKFHDASDHVLSLCRKLGWSVSTLHN